jgi:hypothetical protein
MNSPQRKTTGTLQAPVVSSTDRSNHETVSTVIVNHPAPTAKEFLTLCAKFAICGYQLTELKRSHGQTIWNVVRLSQTRVFSHWHDVEAFLTQAAGKTCLMSQPFVNG